MAHDDSIKAAFGEWLPLSQIERREKGLPTSMAAWGRTYGVGYKTLQRWKAADPVVTVAQSRAEARAEAAETPTEDAPESPIEAIGKLQEGLLEKALKGDEKATDQFMRYFGKDALEEERRARQAGIKALTDKELIVEILDMIGASEVEKWLEVQHG